MRILVVEDETGLARQIAAALTEAGTIRLSPMTVKEVWMQQRKLPSI